MSNEPTGFGQSMTNIGIWQLQQQNRTQANIALAELNMLRSHQGLPPLTMQDMAPPPLIGGSIGALINIISVLGLYATAAFAIGAVVFFLVIMPLCLMFGIGT